MLSDTLSLAPLTLSDTLSLAPLTLSDTLSLAPLTLSDTLSRRGRRARARPLAQCELGHRR